MALTCADEMTINWQRGECNEHVTEQTSAHVAFLLWAKLEDKLLLVVVWCWCVLCIIFVFFTCAYTAFTSILFPLL